MRWWKAFCEGSGNLVIWSWKCFLTLFLKRKCAYCSASLKVSGMWGKLSLPREGDERACGSLSLPAAKGQVWFECWRIIDGSFAGAHFTNLKRKQMIQLVSKCLQEVACILYIWFRNKWSRICTRWIGTNMSLIIHLRTRIRAAQAYWERECGLW